MAVAQMVATMTNRPVLRFSHAEQHTGRRVEEACSVICASWSRNLHAMNGGYTGVATRRTTMLFSVRWRGHPEDSLARKHATLLAEMRTAAEMPKAQI